MIVIEHVLHIASIEGPAATTIDGQSLAQILDYEAGGGGTSTATIPCSWGKLKSLY